MIIILIILITIVAHAVRDYNTHLQIVFYTAEQFS